MYTVDGLPPDSANWNLQAGTGFRSAPGSRANLMELPGMDGVIPDNSAPFMPGTLPLQYQLHATTHEELVAIINKFNGIFNKRRTPLTIQHTVGTTTLETKAQKTNPANIQLHTDTLATYTLELQILTPFWRSQLEIASQAIPLTTTPTEVVLTGWSGSAPVQDAKIRFKGGFSTATVKNPVTGDEIVISGALGDTAWLVVNAAMWKAVSSASLFWQTDEWWTGIAGNGNFASWSSNKGQGTAFGLEPYDLVNSAGKYSLLVSCTNPAAAPNAPTVEVRAKLSYF